MQATVVADWSWEKLLMKLTKGLAVCNASKQVSGLISWFPVHRRRYGGNESAPT